MIHQVIRQTTHWLYKHVAKPLLFLRPPDAVHEAMVATTIHVQRIPLLRDLPRLWSHYDDDALSQKIAGVEFRNPIGLSAGFDKQIQMPPMIKAVGFGWMTGGSVTWGKYGGNEGAWFYRLPKTKSLVVNAGLPSQGSEAVANRIAGYDARLFSDFPLSVSVAMTNSRDNVSEQEAIKDYCDSLRLFDTLDQVKLHEINISCPNTFGGEPFTTSKRLENLLSAVDELKLKKPVFIKMPINLPIQEFDGLLDVIVSHGVAAVTIGNLNKDRTSVDFKEPLPSQVKGNLSGAPNRAITTELIRHTYRRYGDQVAIVGVGGVFDADDAYEKIRAGASLVALITGMIFEGPNVVGAINYDLARLLKRDGFDNIAQAVGTDS